MALSLPRPVDQAPVRDLRQQPVPASPASPAARPTWALERGASRWASVADVAGAFPGFTRQGGLLAGCRVRLTERYLLVDEGRSHGFGLPLSALRGVTLAAPADAGSRQRAGLCLTYHDGVAERAFQIRPRASRLSWSRDRFEDALSVFRLAGHEPRVANPPANLLISREEARHCRSENVIWSGRATAPLDAHGFVRASADLWLTTRSLMWSAGPEHGIHRVELERLTGVLADDLADQAATPILTAGMQTAEGARRDLIFIFDRNLPFDRNGRERGALLVGFRSRGVAAGAAPGAAQPWRRDWWPTPPVTLVTNVATETPIPAPPPSPVTPTAAQAPDTEPAPAAAAPEALPAPPSLRLARAFEAEALTLLAEADAHARDRLPGPAGEFPVLATSLNEALAEIEAAEAAGTLDPVPAAARRAALLALSEAGSRLRALVRLHQSGQISSERLESRRLAILQPLDRLLLESDPSPG